MFDIIKFLTWLAGTVVLALIVLYFLGYEVNMNYFNESKEACQKRLEECSKELVKQGTQNAQCDFNCVNVGKLIIKKK